MKKLQTDLKMYLNEKLNTTTWETEVFYGDLETAFLIYVCF